jgi:3',5'-cyclic AMP phosphodiesterase CpdA
MTIQIAHIGDMHFGGLANMPVVEALERMLPDLRPDAIVIGGDLSQRARHGEFQRGRAFANLCRETARTPSTRSIAATSVPT